MKLDEIVNRIGYFRNLCKCSARELSLRIGKHDTYVNKLESKDFNIPASVLLEIIEALGISCEHFFAKDFVNYGKNKEITDLFVNLSSDNKELLTELMKKLK